MLDHWAPRSRCRSAESAFPCYGQRCIPSYEQSVVWAPPRLTPLPVASTYGARSLLEGRVHGVLGGGRTKPIWPLYPFPYSTPANFVSALSHTTQLHPHLPEGRRRGTLSRYLKLVRG